MKITPDLFQAYLKCPTKCWLRFTCEPPAGNPYAEWVQTENESYRTDSAKRLVANATADECAPPLGSSRREEAHYSAENLKTAKWRLALDVPAQIELRSSRGNEAQTSSPEISQSLLTSAATIETRLHAVERVPSEGRGKPAQFVPIRFIFRNKLTKDDRLLLAFDALVLSQVLGREVSLGKIMHGDDHAMLKVRTSALAGEVRKHLEKIAALLASPTPPDLVLNRHCVECEFQARCRKIAVEKDDLSLLARMSAKERQQLRSKGILVSDFYTAYDSLPCEQQKCLAHFVRDIDDDLLRNPLDTEFKAVATEFGSLLQAIMQTVDRYGLKKRHLHKHTRQVVRFLDSMASRKLLSELAVKYQKRFQKSGPKMFTFLEHDGVPWNNNNAEHAIKRFAKYRRDANGKFTEASLREYLVLASVLETCEFNNVSVLDFLLSKETTLSGLFKMAGRKTEPLPVLPSEQTSPPPSLPLDAFPPSGGPSA
jgi:CRISPR/Cas system-associated exonuclease Cas4 (RecB family)